MHALHHVLHACIRCPCYMYTLHAHFACMLHACYRHALHACYRHALHACYRHALHACVTCMRYMHVLHACYMHALHAFYRHTLHAGITYITCMHALTQTRINIHYIYLPKGQFSSFLQLKYFRKPKNAKYYPYQLSL